MDPEQDRVEHIEIDITGSHQDNGLASPTDEDQPPNYDTLGAGDSEENLPPLDYDVIMGITPATRPMVDETPVQTSPMVDETPVQTSESIIPEAPPSYRQIFGKRDDEDSLSQNKIRKWRRNQQPHTLSRRSTNSGSSDSSRNSFHHLPKVSLRIIIIAISFTVLSLTLSMLVVGCANIDSCSRVDVPLYLIIAGLFLSVEVIIHTCTILITQSTDSETTIRSLRLCDCLALFILIWILIGSNWVFKISLHPSPCTELNSMGNENLGNSSDLSSFTFSSEEDCEDCSVSVYKFTSAVIIIQYVIAFIVLVTCCSTAIKGRAGDAIYS